MPDRLVVAFREPLPDPVRGIAEEALAGFAVRIPEPGAPDAVSAAEVLIARRRRIGDPELDLAKPALVLALGRNPVAVDLEAARRRGIPVRAIPHPGAIAVADHTLALLLAVARRIVEGDRGVRAAEYWKRGLTPGVTSERSFAFNWLGRDDALVLENRVLGLVGFGAIGQEVARRAAGFGLRVRYFQREPLPRAWNRRLGVEPADSLEDLLRSAEALSLHAPHTAETENLLDGPALDRLPRGAILVNTARGGLVDEAALAERLRDGRLGGAGLDVFRREPLPAGHPFVDTPRLVLAPHTGGAGAGGQRELYRRAADAIREFAESSPGGTR